jgi:hypothetical protein
VNRVHGQSFQRRWQYHEAILAEVANERATALGLAGARLTEAVAEYRALLEDDGDADAIAAAFTRTRDAAWALVVQRECAGFRSRNLNWLRETWQVPDEVIRQI